MDAFLENAQKIFDVAHAGQPGSDFALLVRPDGGLHFIMESPVSLEAAAIHAGAHTGYYVTRAAAGVRVEGRSGGRECMVAERKTRLELLRDQPLYRITSPLLTSAAA